MNSNNKLFMQWTALLLLCFVFVIKWSILIVFFFVLYNSTHVLPMAETVSLSIVCAVLSELFLMSDID